MGEQSSFHLKWKYIPRLWISQDKNWMLKTARNSWKDALWMFDYFVVASCLAMRDYLVSKQRCLRDYSLESWICKPGWWQLLDSHSSFRRHGNYYFNMDEDNWVEIFPYLLEFSLYISRSDSCCWQDPAFVKFWWELCKITATVTKRSQSSGINKNKI